MLYGVFQKKVERVSAWDEVVGTGRMLASVMATPEVGMLARRENNAALWCLSQPQQLVVDTVFPREPQHKTSVLWSHYHE